MAASSKDIELPEMPEKGKQLVLKSEKAEKRKKPPTSVNWLGPKRRARIPAPWGSGDEVFVTVVGTNLDEFKPILDWQLAGVFGQTWEEFFQMEDDYDDEDGGDEEEATPKPKRRRVPILLKTNHIRVFSPKKDLRTTYDDTIMNHLKKYTSPRPSDVRVVIRALSKMELKMERDVERARASVEEREAEEQQQQHFEQTRCLSLPSTSGAAAALEAPPLLLPRLEAGAAARAHSKISMNGFGAGDHHQKQLVEGNSSGASNGMLLCSGKGSKPSTSFSDHQKQLMEEDASGMRILVSQNNKPSTSLSAAANNFADQTARDITTSGIRTAAFSTTTLAEVHNANGPQAAASVAAPNNQTISRQATTASSTRTGLAIVPNLLSNEPAPARPPIAATSSFRPTREHLLWNPHHRVSSTGLPIVGTVRELLELQLLAPPPYSPYYSAEWYPAGLLNLFGYPPLPPSIIGSGWPMLALQGNPQQQENSEARQQRSESESPLDLSSSSKLD